MTRRFVTERREGAFAITLMEGRSSVARLGAIRGGAGALRDGPAVMRVARIDVVPGSRRQGVATALYERAARLACREHCAPLASDFSRTPASDTFWRKQYVKRRATCYRRREQHCEQYVFACPAPASLAGRRRKVQR